MSRSKIIESLILGVLLFFLMDFSSSSFANSIQSTPLVTPSVGELGNSHPAPTSSTEPLVNPFVEPSITQPNCTTFDTQCQNYTFTTENFITHITNSMSKKFPFDALGTSSNANIETECPQFVLWGQTQQICEINTVIGAAKYPIWIVFLIRIVLA